jgi:formiminotetrahydrofolate cyclodeaminase
LSLLQLPAAQFLDRIAGPEPTPGGGSAAALAGAMAAALVEMVCAMPKTRSGRPEERARLDAARTAASGAAARLRKLVDDDAAAYDAVVAAYRLPKASQAEKTSRKTSVALAMKRATEVPLFTAEACLEVLAGAREAVDHGNPNALSDARTGAALAWAGLVGALENVRINAAPEGWGESALARADSLQREAQERVRELKLLG